MAGSSEAGRVAALALSALLAAQGCATGGAFRSARLTDSPLRYEEAYTDGERLWLVYQASTRNGDGHEVERGLRAARIELGDLHPDRGHPIDAFPLARLEGARVPRAAATKLPLWIERAGASPAQDAPGLLVHVADGRHDGFTPQGLAGLPPDARFHSGALVERRTAAWVWLSLPWTVTADAVTLTLILPVGTAFFVSGE
jgi:hypothetical protein